MKQFFRLFFIIFGLLFILSMSAESSMELADNKPPATSTFSFAVLQASLIPVAITDAPPLSAKFTLLPEGQSTTTAQIEVITSIEIQTKLCFFRESFLQYSLAILQRKGNHIFLSSQKDDHFLI